MNKRIKKKRLLADLLQVVSQQQEVIENYGNQLAQVKRELTDLRLVVEWNTQATNGRFDYLEKKVAGKVSGKSCFGRK